MKALVCGAGGFIGGHLVADLLGQGLEVRAVDCKSFGEWHQVHQGAESRRMDLRGKEECHEATRGVNWVFNLAADMGGMGYIETHKAYCMLSVLINTHLLLASVVNRVERFFFSSSACVYNITKQADPLLTPLKEEDAYPAMPEDGYGWEKLFSERMCRHFAEDFGLDTRVARFHNVYGPHGTYEGGREKAPAAICRKVIEAKLNGLNEIEIWGDGNQTRSFMWIGDCIKGINLIMKGGYAVSPINLGSSELVSINQLVGIVEGFAGPPKLQRRYNLDAPKGVMGRNSDNTLIKRIFGWFPSTRLVEGMRSTYDWIYDQITERPRC